MKNYKKPAAVLLTLGIVGTLAGNVIAVGQSLQARDASVKFDYRVALIPVKGTVNALTSETTVDFDKISSTKAKIKVNLNSLKTGIALRDQHARESLNAKKNPNVLFEFKKYTPAKDAKTGKTNTSDSIANGETHEGFVGGDFTLNGVKKSIEVPVSITRTDQTLKVNTFFDVIMTDHKIVTRKGGAKSAKVDVSFVLKPGKN